MNELNTLSQFARRRWIAVVVAAALSLSSDIMFAQQDPYTAIYNAKRPAVAMLEVTFLRKNANTGHEETIQRQGSAFAVDADQILLTSSHVVAGAKHPLIILYPDLGRRFIGEVVAVDHARDLAAVQLKGNEVPQILPLRLATNREQIAPAKAVLSIGYSSGRTYWGFLDGKINQVFMNHPKLQPVTGLELPAIAANIDIEEVLRTTIKPSRGHSGGPLLDLNGDVLGMVALADFEVFEDGTRKHDEGFTLCLPFSAIRDFKDHFRDERFKPSTTAAELPFTLAAESKVEVHKPERFLVLSQESPERKADNPNQWDLYASQPLGRVHPEQLMLNTGIAPRLLSQKTLTQMPTRDYLRNAGFAFSFTVPDGFEVSEKLIIRDNTGGTRLITSFTRTGEPPVTMQVTKVSWGLQWYRTDRARSVFQNYGVVPHRRDRVRLFLKGNDEGRFLGKPDAVVTFGRLDNRISDFSTGRMLCYRYRQYETVGLDKSWINFYLIRGDTFIAIDVPMDEGIVDDILNGRETERRFRFDERAIIPLSLSVDQ